MAKNQLFVDLGIFGQTPIELLKEEWLTFNTLKVYIALVAYQGPNKQSFPSREEIADRAAMKPDKVSSALTTLVKNGWVARKRRMNASNIYKCLTRATSADFFAGLDETSFVPEKGTSHVAESDTNDVALSASLKDHVKRSLKKIKKEISPEESEKRREIREHFKSIYKQANGTEPIIAAKENSLIAKASSFANAQEVCARMKSYWNGGHWTTAKGDRPTLAGFINAWNDIKTIKREEPKPLTYIPPMRENFD